MDLQELLQKYPDEITLILLQEKMPTCAKAAEMLGLQESDITKTCILKTDTNTFAAAILPGHARMNQNTIRRLLGCKKVRFATAEEVLEASGYVAGGVPPIGLKPTIARIFMDSSLLDHPFVIAGGGIQEALIKIAPKLIQSLTGAQIAAITS